MYDTQKKKLKWTKKVLAYTGFLFVTPIYAYNIQDAQTVASTNASCNAVGSFYWEIGDGNGMIAHGTGSQTSNIPSPTTPVYVDSASKWIWAAYVLQKRGGVGGLLPGSDGGYENSDVSYLQLGDGYTSSPTVLCTFLSTVSGCYKQLAPQNTSDVAKFYYSGGDFLAQANNSLNLGSMNYNQLTKEVGSYIPNVTFKYTTPNIAASIEIDSNDYAQFLRNIINNTLDISQALSVDSWCTNTGENSSKTPYCPTAVYTPPLPNNIQFQYSLGHWIETDPQASTDGGTVGDGAFSSPGESGFYPWIDSTKTYYGIVNPSGTSQLIPANPLAYQNAVLCGQAIRSAFINN